MVGVILACIVGIGVCSETPVDDGGRRVDVYFTALGAAWRRCAFSGLNADVPDWSIEVGTDELRVVLIHHLAVDER